MSLEHHVVHEKFCAHKNFFKGCGHLKGHGRESDRVLKLEKSEQQNK